MVGRSVDQAPTLPDVAAERDTRRAEDPVDAVVRGWVARPPGAPAVRGVQLSRCGDPAEGLGALVEVAGEDHRGPGRRQAVDQPDLQPGRKVPPALVAVVGPG